MSDSGHRAPRLIDVPEEHRTSALRRRTIRCWLRYAQDMGLDRLEAEHLLARALNCARSTLYAHPERRPEADVEAVIQTYFARCKRGEPLAYILGEQPFMGLTIEVQPSVLIPRPDTETLVEAALARLYNRQHPVVLELGTGSGAVAVALAHAHRTARIVATDLCDQALAVARRNAERLVPGRIEFRLGRWYEPVASERFDLILANPPYLSREELRRAEKSLAYEPLVALDGGEDGLAALREVIAGAPTHLLPGGVLLVEHGATQADAVRRLMADSGLSEVVTLRDFAGRERVGLGVLSPAR